MIQFNSIHGDEGGALYRSFIAIDAALDWAIKDN